MKPRLAEWITIAGLAVAIVIWAVRLEGQVNAQDREHKAVVEQMREDIRYIRDRVDRALAIRP